MAKKQFGIIGLGRFGSYLARTLAEQGQEVVAVDRSEKAVEEISSVVSQAVVADATRKETLEHLGFDKMDTVVVAIGSLAQSVLVTLFLKELGARNIIAKALNEEGAKILSLIGAHRVIIPERDSAIRLARSLVMPNFLDFLPLLPDFYITEVKPPPEFVGKSLKELDLRRKYRVYVIGVKRAFADQIQLLPPADYVIERDDILYLVGHQKDLAALALEG
ncbi:TrkA family potassium uptake protein [Thermosulfurimonas marina]|uniref:TrkA family potassium uptake protein n=1 Tax=Thermosulfurimonas marina TaxID=2047767 RepID=A0A6H1WT72_9BACT|nr:TrkA family potassium uptake protein [Thermosulfurimonas marina]QJA06371.1 TrkA family potassium uptake protein [Thermosulfurimonas marina]